MSIEWTDGFDYYNSDAFGSLLWDSFSTTSFTAGRFGTGQSIHGLNATKILTSVQTRIVSFAFRIDSIQSALLVQFKDSSTVQMDFRIDSANRPQITRNGTVLATAANPVGNGIWNHFQIKIKVDSSTGTYEVRQNGIAIITGSGANTQVSGNASSDRIVFAWSGGATNYWDDIVILNTAGAVNNNFPGDNKIVTTYPTGNGATHNFTPLAGSNWQEVSEHPPDNDTSYNSDSTVNDIDLYTRDPLTITGAVLAVKHTIVCRKDDAGTRQVAGIVRSGSTNYVGATQTLPSSYIPTSDLYETDPDTSALWTQTGLNNAQFGVKVIT